MRYIGGKSKMAREMARVILEREEVRDLYVEPFVGGGSVLALVAPHFRTSFASDLSTDLILMWSAVLDGWEPPERISEDEYKSLRNAEPSALRGFAGFGGSFGGKWFGGYARGGFNADGTPRNHQAESRRAVLRIRDSIYGSDVHFSHSDYKTVPVSNGAVVYCDPPYSDTQGYDAVGGFDSDEFWSVATGWADVGARVYVSEYSAPDGWECVWEKAHRQSLTRTDQGRGETVERLFVRG